MRYDDFDDYNSRSSRSGGSRGSSRSGGSRDRDYDRGYSDRGHSDRSYSDRGYDRGRSYEREYGGYSDRGYSDRGYSDRSYGRSSYEDSYGSYGGGYDSRSSDRYGGRSSRDYYDDFDRRSWERTAPNWDDRGSSRGRSSSSGSRDRDRDRRAPGGDRRSSGSSRGGSGRPSDRSRNSSHRSGSRSGSRSRGGSSRGRSSGRREIPLLPIAICVVVIVVAIIIISSLLGGGDSGYKLELASDTIVAGETTTATITGLSEAEEYEIRWFTNDSGIVSVEGDGATCTLTAKSVGTAVVSASVNDESLNKTVMVVDTAPGVVKINMSQEEVEVYAGETYTAHATVLMESDDMPEAKLTWESNDPSVARVDQNGVVTAREVGVAIIKASAGEKTAEMAVNVVENPNNRNHDESRSTGTEPEAGAELPDDALEGDGDSTASNEVLPGGSSGGEDAGDTGADSAGGEPEGGQTGMPEEGPAADGSEEGTVE